MDEWALVEGEATKEVCAAAKGSLIASVARGDLLDVLRSSTASLSLRSFARAVGSANGPPQLDGFVAEYDTAAPKDSLCVAIAALHAFVQANWTGPDLDEELRQPVKLLRRVAPDAFPARNADEGEDDSDAKMDGGLQTASLDSLTWAGEPAYHLCQVPFLLAFALRLFDSLAKSGVTSAPWWRLRAYAVHSRILEMPLLPPTEVMDAASGVKRYLIEQHSADSATSSRWGQLLARYLVDEALTLQRAGRERDANDRFLEAARASGLQYEVTGAPGKRTKFQKTDRMILVLLARSAGEPIEDVPASATTTDAEEEAELHDAAPNGLSGPDRTGWKAAPSTDGAANMPSDMLHNDDTLLERTRFTSTSAGESSSNNAQTTFNDADVSKPTVLSPLDSCVLLGLCLNIHNTAPENGLTSSEMSAFVNRVLAHARNWSVHTMALLLRSRLEADRSRTAQRSALQLQALLDQMPTSDSSLGERLQLVHELELPSKWEMQAELARRYAALGVLRSALEIFERIEFWQEVVQCWGVLGRQDKGIEVIRDLLQGRKAEADHVIAEKRTDRAVHVRRELNVARQAKLWCLLGDLEPDKAQEHYVQAWQVSGRRSARAARSMGAITFTHGELAKATLWLRRALRIQPLYARSWFMLGCVYTRRDTGQAYLEAARCFRRCVTLEDEDAESWNNLASCYLRLAQQSEAALREARMANDTGAEADQRAVLTGAGEDGDDDQSDADSLHSRDSGVAGTTEPGTEEDDSDDTDTEEGIQERRRRRRVQQGALNGDSVVGSGQGAFDVKLLAHRALGKALRFAHDDWRVWSNFMIVSVDCGLMNDAVRALRRVVEIRGGARAAALADKLGGDGSDGLQDAVDMPVLNRIVDAVTRAPSSEQDAIVGQNGGPASVAGGPTQAQVQHNPHEGHGLWPAVSSLFEDVLLPRITASASLWRAYARLLFWRARFRGALEAHLAAWRASYGAESSAVDTDKAQFTLAVEALQELCEVLENFGPRSIMLDEHMVELDIDAAKTAAAASSSVMTNELAMDNWRFRARSLVRTFMGRTRDAFEGEAEWDHLVELRDSLAPSAA